MRSNHAIVRSMFSDLPFLYRTKTIIRGAATSSSRSKNSKARLNRTSPTLQQSPDPPVKPSSTKKSTLPTAKATTRTFTKSEYVTFGKLLGRQPSTKPSQKATAEEEARISQYNSLYNKIFLDSRQETVGSTQNNSVSWQYVDDTPWGKPSDAADGDPGDQAHSRTQLRLPIARSDSNITSEIQAVNASGSEILFQPPSAEICQLSSYVEISGLLQNATSDVEVHKVLTQRVFPLLAEMSPQAQTTTVSRPGNLRQSADKVDRPGSELVATPQKGHKTVSQTSLHVLPPTNLNKHLAEAKDAGDQVRTARMIFGPLIALAAHQLLTVFKSPHMILNLRWNVYNSGILSRVLGLSSTLYHAVIKAQGTWLSDLASLDETLAEMESQGVEFDENTWKILDQIVADAEWEREELTRARKETDKVKLRVGGMRLSGLLGNEGMNRVIAWRDKVARILAETRKSPVETTHAQ